MSDGLTLDEILAAQSGQKGKPAAGAKPVDEGMTLEQITGVTPPFEPTVMGFLKDTENWREMGKTLGNAAYSVGKFVGAIPGMMVGAVAGPLRASEELVKGTPRREALKAGLDTAGRVGENLNLMKPVDIALKYFGVVPDQTILDSAMETFMKKIHHYGEKVEVGSNRGILAEDVDMFAQVLMGAMAGKGTVRGGKALGEKIAGTAPVEVPASQGRVMAALNKDLGKPTGPSAARKSYAEPEVTPAEGEAPAQPSTTRGELWPEPKTAEEIAAEAKARRKDVAAAVKAETPAEKAARTGGAPPEGTATWSSGGVDYPVNILGPIEMGPDGRPYRRVSYQGHESYVPADELKGHTIDLPLEKGKTEVELNVDDPTAPKTEGELRHEEAQHRMRWEAEKARRAMEEDLAERAHRAPPTELELLEERLNPRGQAKGRRYDRWGNAGKADPELLAGIAAAGGVAAYIAANPDKLEDIAKVGAIGATAPYIMKKGKFAGKPESLLIEQYREAARSGDRLAQDRAAAEIYNEHSGYLDRYLQQFMGKDRGGLFDVEDVKQEVMKKGFEVLAKPADAVGGFRGDTAQFRTFLTAMAKNKAMNAHRWESTRPKTELTDEMESAGLASHMDTPERRALNEAMATAMKDAIQKLPEDFRETFWMAEVEGMPYAEIAERRGIPVATVKTQIFRSKERLQKMLREYNIDAKSIAGIAAISGGAVLAGYLEPDHSEVQMLAAGMLVPAALGHPNTKAFLQGEKAGMNRDILWKTTQTARSADGTLVHEMPDPARGLKNLKVNPHNKTLVSLPDPPKGTHLTVKDILDHPKLFKLIPEIKDIRVLPERLGSTARGSWDGIANVIRLAGATYEGMAQALMHELQHVVQTKYGMNLGGNKAEFLPPQHAVLRGSVETKILSFRKRAAATKGAVNYMELEDAFSAEFHGEPLSYLQREQIADAQQVFGMPELKEYRQLYQTASELTALENAAYDRYYKLGGEAQARAVANRLFMTQAELRDIPPWQDLEQGRKNPRGYDTPESEWEIRRASDASMPSESVDVQERLTASAEEVKQARAALNRARLRKQGIEGMVDPSVDIDHLAEKPGTLHTALDWAKRLEDAGWYHEGLRTGEKQNSYLNPYEYNKYGREAEQRYDWDVAQKYGLEDEYHGKYFTKPLAALPEAGVGGKQGGAMTPRQMANLALLTGGAIAGFANEHKLQDAMFGAGVGLLLSSLRPKDWIEGYRRAQAQGPLRNITDLVKDVAYQKKVQKLAVAQLATNIVTRVPDLDRRVAIYEYLENEKPVKLTPEEREVAALVKEFYTKLGAEAKKAGVIREVLDDYATRIYGKEAKGLFEGKQVGGDARLDSPFGKHRGYKTRAAAEAAGYVPVTLDIARVLEMYSDSINGAIQNRRFIDTLRNVKGEYAGLIAPAQGAPAGYAYISHPQMRGYLAHPDIAADLRFVFESNNTGAIIGMLDAVNSTQKRMGVSLSLFHASALEQALLGGMSVFKSPVLGAKAFGQSFFPQIFGESLAVKMLREGGLHDVIDRGMRAGLEHTLDRQGTAASMEDSMHSIYKGMDAATKWLDVQVPRLGTYTTGVYTNLNKMFDRAMWGRFHTTLKIETFLDKASELSRNNAREVEAGRGQLKSQAEIDRMAASFTNDLYGGLNWYQIVSEMNSRWGRELASAALGPTGRLVMRLLLFAPDWTISTTRAFTKAFGPRGLMAGAGTVAGMQMLPNTEDGKLIGGVIGGLAGYGASRALRMKKVGSGLRGALPGELGGRATELADLHRQYILRSAFIYTTIVDALNYQYSGHHLWENKDPTRLDLGDGRTMMASKHFMEPFHWLIDPKKQLMGKASFIVKESMSQLGDVEYWSPHGAPRMGGTDKGDDISLPTRMKHAGKQFLPISAQAFEQQNPQSALASMAGFGIYGRTLEQKAEAKAEAKARAIQRRIEKRERESR